MQARNIVVIGNFGAGNLGDDAIFGGILTDFKAIGFRGEIAVTHGGQPTSTDIYRGIKKIPFMPSGFRSHLKGISKATSHAIKSADIVIFGGGGLFTDQESIFAPAIWANQIKLCKKFGKPYICYGQSIGPLKHWFNRYITKKVFIGAKAICVRDQTSKIELNKLGIKNITVGTDTAFSWLYEINNRLKDANKKTKTLLIAMRLWPKIDENDLAKYIKELTLFASEQGLKPILMAMDVRNKREINYFYKTGLEVFVPASASGAFAGIIRSKMLVCMRLHAGIMATISKTNFLALSYSQKVNGLLPSIKMDLATLKQNLKNPSFSIVTNREIKSQIIKNQDFLSRAIDLQ